MKEKKVLTLIYIICVAIAIAIIGIVVLKITGKKENNSELKKEREEYLYYQENPAQVIEGKKATKTSITNLYVMVDECIKSYYSMVKADNSEVILAYLNEEFIKTNNITYNNLYTFVKKYDDYDSYRTTDMYDLAGTKYAEYYVKGKINGYLVYFIVGIDNSNATFDIKPIDEIEFKNKIETNAKVSETEEQTISKKTYNFYRIPNITDEELSRKYYVDYIKLMLTDIEQAYSMLNEQYKTKRFGNIDNFKRFINNNKNFLMETYNVESADSSKYNNYADYAKYVEARTQYKMKSYAVNTYKDYTQYVCGNITGNNYIFNAKYPMEYEVYLDTFTIDLPEFTEKYNNSSDKNKVLMNIEKVKNALNAKACGYMYNKLDETFKKNKYPSQKAFEEYMNKNLFEQNIFNYNSVKNDGKLYITNITVTDASEKNSTKKTMTIIMQLKEGTDFVMSFSFN